MISSKIEKIDWTTDENGTEFCQDESGVRIYRLGSNDRIKPLQQYIETPIAEKYGSAMVKDFNISFDPKLKPAKIFAKGYVKKFDQIRGQGKGYYLYSNQPGSGKTMLACCILNGLSKKYEISTQAITAVDLMRRLKDTFDNEDISEQSVINPMLAVGVLLIDDLGSQKQTDWSDDILYYIVDSRLSRKKPTFFTSNYSIDQLMCHERIKSRINSITAQIRMPEKDIRALVAKQEQNEFLSNLKS